MAISRVEALAGAGRRARGASGYTLVGAGILAAIVVASVAVPPLLAWGPTEIDFDATLAPPGSEGHPLGTDRNGMDIFARLLYAARLDLFVAFASVALAVTVGGALGALVGYAGGWLDELAMRVMDIFQSFPAFVLALAVAAILGTGTGNLIFVIALVNAPGYVRLMRAEVRSTREHGYVEAARAAGQSSVDVLVRQVVPNSLRPILVVAPLNCGWAILTLAGLSFLGLGVQVPEPEWGAMIATGADDLVSGKWWTSVMPGLLLFTTVLAFNLLSEGGQSGRRGR